MDSAINILAIAALGALVGLALRWRDRDLKRKLMKKHASIEQIRVRLEDDHGIRVNHSHIECAAAFPLSGISRLAEMRDGTLSEILLHGKDVKAYFKDGSTWRPFSTGSATQ